MFCIIVYLPVLSKAAGTKGGMGKQCDTIATLSHCVVAMVLVFPRFFCLHSESDPQCLNCFSGCLCSVVKRKYSLCCGVYLCIVDHTSNAQTFSTSLYRQKARFSVMSYFLISICMCRRLNINIYVYACADWILQRGNIQCAVIPMYFRSHTSETV